ncbi:MAG: hypothetical protein BroJett009_14560 [Armatimonadota bacterium]|nr:MAG: hypothetical protein BroJett009_14560 [Armatimonadota bacterium]
MDRIDALYDAKEPRTQNRAREHVSDHRRLTEPLENRPKQHCPGKHKGDIFEQGPTVAHATVSLQARSDAP